MANEEQRYHVPPSSCSTGRRKSSRYEPCPHGSNSTPSSQVPSGTGVEIAVVGAVPQNSAAAAAAHVGRTAVTVGDGQTIAAAPALLVASAQEAAAGSTAVKAAAAKSSKESLSAHQSAKLIDTQGGQDRADPFTQSPCPNALYEGVRFTNAAAAAEGEMGGSRRSSATAALAANGKAAFSAIRRQTVSAASVAALAGESSSSNVISEVPTSILLENSSDPGAASAVLLERAYSLSGAYALSIRRLADATEAFQAVEASLSEEEEEEERFAEGRCASAKEAATEGAESACESSARGTPSDCCGCGRPTADACGGDAAGVPPYLRIDDLPALLEEGAAGRDCVLLGQKKEALLYSVATPFGLNKWVLVCIYMLYALLTGCVYFGWPSMSYMLLESGAYSWRCAKDSNGEFVVDLRKPQNASTNTSAGGASLSNDRASSGNAAMDKEWKYYICDEQDAAVSPLFTIAYVTQSLMSVVAGTLLDHVSPKRAAMLGQLLNFIGWVLLACSSYTFQAYVPAMIFIGLGADTAYLPTLLVAALFPGKRATVITMLGSANTASFAVPLLLELLYKANPSWSFSHLCWLYLGVGPIFCFCLAALFIPQSSFASAALRKLPLHHHQQESSLHDGKEDALLTAAGETSRKKTKKTYCLKRRKRHTPWCSCLGVSSAVEDQQEQKRLHKRHMRVICSEATYSGCCCRSSIDLQHTAATSEAGALGPKQRQLCLGVLRGLVGCKLRLRAAVQQLQRLPGVRRFSDKRSGSGGCCLWLSRESSRRVGWDGSAESIAVPADVSTAATSVTREQSTPVTDGDTAKGGIAVEAAQGYNEAKKCPQNGKPAFFEWNVRSGSRGGVAACAQAEGCLRTQAEGNFRDEVSIKDPPSGEVHFETDFCCTSVCSEPHVDDKGSPAVQQETPLSCASFLPQTSTDSEQLEGARVAINHSCERHLPSDATVLEEGRRDIEVDLVTAAANGLRHPSAAGGDSISTAVEEEEDEEPSFCSQLLSSHFMCIVLYWSNMAVAISYFQSASSRLFSTKTLDFMDLALSFSFVPCVLLGKMTDLFGPFPVLFLVNTMGALAYCFALGGGSPHALQQSQNVLHFLSILAFCVYVSVDSEQVFCYVENTFNAKHFGKLSGLALTAGGVISLVSIPLYEEVTIRLLHKNPFPVCCGLLLALVVVYFTLGSMWFVRSKHPPAFKARKKKQMRSAPAADVSAGERGTVNGAAEPIKPRSEEIEQDEETYGGDGDGGDTPRTVEIPICLCKMHNDRCCCCAASGCADDTNRSDSSSQRRRNSNAASSDNL